jgi:tRNA (guanine-N7-)-methyltransferase
MTALLSPDALAARPDAKLSALTLPWPCDWQAVFAAHRPLILEIGFGTATFLEYLARTRPDASIIGVEIANQCLLKAEKRVARGQMTNVRVVHSRAETALHYLFVPASLHAVYINFPDPWFKRDHHHRRLMQRETLDAITSRLQPGGMLFLATDIHDYAKLAHDLLRTTPGLDNAYAVPWRTQPPPDRIVTKYEQKAAREGRTCHYFAYRRNAQPAPDIPVMLEMPMTHVVFHSPLTLDELFAAYEPFKHSDGTSGIHVGFMEAFRNASSILFEVNVSEPTIDQHTAFRLAHHRHQPHEYTLALASIGHPRPTPGMHVAVRTLAQRLLALHPDAHVLIDKLSEDAD